MGRMRSELGLEGREGSGIITLLSVFFLVVSYRWSARYDQWWECKFLSEGIIDQGKLVCTHTIVRACINQYSPTYSCLSHVHAHSTQSRGICCDRFHNYVIAVMLEDNNKGFSLASIVSSSNMAATSLSFDSLGIDCKPSIRNIVYSSIFLG